MAPRQETKKRQATDQVHPFFQSVNKKLKVDRDAEEETQGGPSSVTAPLCDLLDFSSLNADSELMMRFDTIAKALLRDYSLVVNAEDGSKTEFAIMELEFYLQKGGCHEDPFTHGSEEQKISGKWYFHRAALYSKDSDRSLTSTTSYRIGSRKGLDLTFGAPFAPVLTAELSSEDSAVPSQLPHKHQEEHLLRGGILLRSLRLLGPGSKVISGPSLLVDQILSSSGASDIPDLVDNKWNGDTTAFPSTSESHPTPNVSLYLVPKTSNVRNPPIIYSSPRIGLELSHPGTTSPKVQPLHSRIRFLPRKYRYFVCPNELVANGRCQTFLGVLSKTSLSYPDLDAALDSSRVKSEICRITGLKDGTVTRYLADYKAGRAGGSTVLEAFIGPKGKGASSSPASYLKMLGAISTILFS